MNKTRKRAIQKHRAKKLKFEARRKATPQETGASTATAPARPKAASAATAPKSRSSAKTAPVEEAPQEEQPQEEAVE